MLRAVIVAMSYSILMRRLFCIVTAATALGAATGCGAIFPRYTTVLRAAPEGTSGSGELTPAPDFVHRIAAMRAELPRQNREARDWDNDAGPDPYVVVFRNGEEIYRSRTLQNTLTPQWDAAHDFADVRIHDNDTLRIELRDDDGLGSDTVGAIERRGVPADARGGGNWEIRLEGGATLFLQTTTPPAQLGMGVTFDFRDDVLVVISVEEAGPAYSAGLRAGDRIVAIDGRSISSLGDGGSRDGMNRASTRDVQLTVSRPRGNETLQVRRDAVYPSR